ncbi:unnamed protein product [Lathyrus sativus]|nr:unnamed protein product [Lathyrus sativus]
MASRFRSFSQPAFSPIKSTIAKPKSSSPFLLRTRSPVTVRSIAELGCVQILLQNRFYGSREMFQACKL